jgi:glutathione S-transferase
VLELDDGSFLSESVAICRYLEEELRPDPNLFGISARERAEIEMWNRRVELELLLPIMSAFQHLSPYWTGKRTQVEAAGRLSQEQALDRMRWLNDELAYRDHIAGDHYTIADITCQCALVLSKNTGLPAPDNLANLSRWFQAVSFRPTARA